MKKGAWFFLGFLLIVLMTACGGEESSAANPADTVTVEASNWAFDKEEYRATSGDVTIELKNSDGYHGITIDGTDVKIDGEGTSTVSLEKGKYTINCSIPCGEGHGEMTAQLIVE
jgi:cytochrome c oxidase subunit II